MENPEVRVTEIKDDGGNKIGRYSVEYHSAKKLKAKNLNLSQRIAQSIEPDADITVLDKQDRWLAKLELHYNTNIPSSEHGNRLLSTIRVEVRCPDLDQDFFRYVRIKNMIASDDTINALGRFAVENQDEPPVALLNRLARKIRQIDRAQGQDPIQR